MRKILVMIAVLVLCLAALPLLSGCEDSPVMGFVVSTEQVADEKEMKNTAQPTEIGTDKDIFASVYFIESPKGMKYTAKWLLDGQEIKIEEKEMLTDKKGMIVYSLEKDLLVPGLLTMQIAYKDEILVEKEINVK